MSGDSFERVTSSPEDKVSRWLSELDYSGLLEQSAGRIAVAERFDWNGRAIDPGYRRVRVIARQLYVLCQAALDGNQVAASLAAPVAETLMTEAFGSNGQFVSRLSREGEILDATPDLYDIAFGLFAMAWWYRLSGDDKALAIAEQSIAHVRGALSSPAGTGYVWRISQPLRHAQNPHMHLFEATILLAQFAERDSFAFFAHELFILTEAKLFDVENGTLAELFDDNWKPCGTTEDRGIVRVEPGHHYEWVWLLHRYANLAGIGRAAEIADELYAFARRHGHHPTTDLVLDAVATNGAVLCADLRIWPNTEFLKAQVAMRERWGAPSGVGRGYGDLDVAANVDRIFRYYLTASEFGPARELKRGFWIDYLQADAVTPKCDHVPASTLYHIVFAFSELLRHTTVRQMTGADGPVRNGSRLVRIGG